jgi:outer membrane receptor protein involved in Fe transport
MVWVAERVGKGWSRACASWLLGGACSLAIATGANAQPRSFSVPAGDLRTALTSYARQAGVQLIYRTDDLRGVRSPGVRGALSPQGALEEVLRGTGFHVRRDASGAVAIVRGPARPAVPVRAAPKPAPVHLTPDGAPFDPLSPVEVEGLIVTGTRLPDPNLTSMRPVAAVSNNEIRLQGATRIEDVLNGLPQAFGGQGSEVSNGATGIATVDLRALGPARTLVLIDGRRMAPGDPTLPVTDLNFIPAQLVDRIDVVTGGASAVYGADAVAGVVNFIMLKNFEGVRLDAQYSVYQHHNRSPLGDLVRARGYDIPEEHVMDGAVTDLTAVIGIGSGDARANATFYATWRKTDSVLLDKRDFASCPLQELPTSNGFVCSGSNTTNPALILSNDRLFAGLPYDLVVSGGGFRPFDSPTDTFNFAPYNYFQRPDERYTFGGFAHYELSRAADVYTQLMFMDDDTKAAIAPSGIFGQTFNLPCSSPLLSPSQAATLCTEAGLGAAESANLLIFRRNVEGGSRQDDLRHTGYRIVGGVRGDIGSSWSYDVYGQHSEVAFEEAFRNDFSLSRIALALDAVRDPATGEIVCRSALDPRTPVTLRGCVPYDIFSPAGPSQAALAYLQTPGFARGFTTEQVVSGQVTGQLGDYGVRSPWSNDGVEVAAGAEYRREELRIDYGVAFLTGDMAGQGGPQTDVNGAFDLLDVFGELRVPLAEERPWLNGLWLEAGYRHSGSSALGQSDAWKLTLDWKPGKDLRIRAGYNRSVRAPNILELFTPTSITQGLANDPCAGPTPILGLAECANTGVSAAQYGRVPQNAFGFYDSLVGGNPELAPETADSFALGFVVTPARFAGFSLSLDYFDIRVDGAIARLTGDFILNSCARTGDPGFCRQVHRDVRNGSLFTGDGFVEDRVVNIASLRTTGLDLEANYRPPLASWGLDNVGALDLSLIGSWLGSLETAPGLPAPTDPNVTSYDCAGLYGSSVCGPPNPRWRHRLRATWSTPADGLSVSLAWRHFGGATSENIGSDNPFFDSTPQPPATARLPAQNYIDVSATWRFRDSYTVRAGVNNLFDLDPPIVGSLLGGADPRFNGNTYPVVYQALGRFIFLGLTADF